MPYFLRFNKFQISPSQPLPSQETPCNVQRKTGQALPHIPAQGPTLCIGPPPNLAANCRLSVAARSRPQCRAGVHARRSSLASPHSAANRRLRRFTICPRRTFPPLSRHTRFRRTPSPPQTSKASPARGGAAAGGGGVPHLAPPIPFRLAAHAPLPHICIGPDALHRLAAKPRGKLSLTRRCPFPATM